MERPSQEMELYTIPSYSSWFSWNNIHEVEKFSLREFFDGSSVTRSPRIYKEYRDFIISKYRENPSRKLIFTEVRKSLIGDVSVLLKVFTFLEKWGLINFTGDNEGGVAKEVKAASFDEMEDENWRVKVEEGAPHGVRVVAAPNSMKPVVVPPEQVAVDGVGEVDFRWPQLASYSDVYQDRKKKKKKGGFICGSCKEDCEGACYEDIKDESFVLCEKCFKSGSHDKSKSPDDFKLKDIESQAGFWTDAETLLLLESVTKHGNNWDLVADSVQSKSKHECISKLIQLPFGDLMLGAAQGNIISSSDVTDGVNNSEQENNDSQEPVKAEAASPVVENNDEQNQGADNEGPPLKKVCTEPTSDMGNSLMKQVARISTMLGPHVSASAADAAIAALCYENQCSKDVFDDDDSFFNPKESPETHELNGDSEVNDATEYENHNHLENQDLPSTRSIIPINLRARAATATALGAAAANAKLLADQEEREIAHLVATIIEAQLKKLHRKMKYVDDLKLIMEKEQSQLLELEESLTVGRINILQRVFSAAAASASASIPKSKGLTDLISSE